MQRNARKRPLAYEQLEPKAAPSSVMLVVPTAGSDPELAATASFNAADLSPAGYDRYETEQILRFVAEHTIGDERAHRGAVLPTAAQCAAADEMMSLLPDQWNSLLVLGYYEEGIEL